VPNLNCSYFLQDYISPNIHLFISLFLVMALGFVSLRKNGHILAKIGFVLIAVGGLHNLWQRVMYICVRDDLNFANLFMVNPADLSITVGTVLILWGLIINGKKNTNNRR